MSKAEEYEIGYGKPPKSGQWKKGQSGNPSGKKKPKKEAPPQALLVHMAQQLSETVSITVHGKKEKVSFGAALARKLLHDLMSASTKEQMKAVETLAKLGVFDLQYALAVDTPWEDPFTEEDRRIIAAITGANED